MLCEIQVLYPVISTFSRTELPTKGKLYPKCKHGTRGKRSTMEPKDLSRILEETVGMAQMEEHNEQSNPIPEELSLLPLREVVIFPGLMAPLGVGRESSIQLVNDCMESGSRLMAVACMRDPLVDNPTLKDIYNVGAIVAIRMSGQTPEGQRLIVQGLRRFEVVEVTQTTPYMKVKVKLIEEEAIPEEDALEIEALKRNIGGMFSRIVQLSPDLPDEMQTMPANVPDPQIITDLVAAQAPRLSYQERQELLEIRSLKKRMLRLSELLIRETQVLELGNRLQSEVAQEMNKTQKEYYLREHMRQIQKELGETDDRTQDLDELRAKIANSKMNDEARKEADREFERLSRMNPAAPDYNVARTYLDWMVSMPWQTMTPDNLDIHEVRRILDSDHYGLDKVKDRILEYLAVRQFKTDGVSRQPILCFVGPPGVGKTSLGRSIAKAMGRKFARISLGGVHDEAEIRGHRRTYIGAMPGQIVQAIKRAETRNPVFMMDEIDKVNSDYRGDPSSALLEVLDPEQNNAFRDHYLDVPFDLSGVLFITTSNVLDTIMPPLRDRMEIIEIAGYTEEEKIAIATSHLVPRQLEEHGLKGKLSFAPETLRALVRGYTRESGVRNLEREIGKICRKVTLMFVQGRKSPLRILPDKLVNYMGSPRFEHEEASEQPRKPGVVTGLVWTPMGGDIISIEASAMPVPGTRPPTLTITGQLGDVMRESAQAALSWVRAHAEEIGASPDFYEHHDIHIHVPAGAIPKDGPSAGITMTTALASLFSGRLVRPLLAMTGEVTLTGRVLPIGGVKEKALGARRAGIKTILLPLKNRKDVVEDLPGEIHEAIKFHFFKDVSEVLQFALEPHVLPTVTTSPDKKPRRQTPPIADVLPSPATPPLH